MEAKIAFIHGLIQFHPPESRTVFRNMFLRCKHLWKYSRRTEYCIGIQSSVSLRSTTPDCLWKSVDPSPCNTIHVYSAFHNVQANQSLSYLNWTDYSEEYSKVNQILVIFSPEVGSGYISCIEVCNQKTIRFELNTFKNGQKFTSEKNQFSIFFDPRSWNWWHDPSEWA